MKEKTPLPKALLEHAPWEGTANPIWLASSFILHRNLSQYPFPAKMDEGQMRQAYSILQNLLLASPLLDQPLSLNAETLGASEKEFLFEHFLCLDGFQNTICGQGFILDKTGLFLGILNVTDHLHLQFLDYEGNWEKTWNKLNQLDMEINAAIELAYHPRFGYLTAYPHLAGTGLTVLVYLHLPALIHTNQLEETLLKHKSDEVTVTSLQGALQDIVGDIVVLKNTYTLGVSEANILHSLHLMAMRLMTVEKSLRSQLKQTPPPEIKDMVSRSFGLLAHSYQLQTKETMQALSLLKLGLDLGWVSKTTHGLLNSSSFRCRRAHLIYECNNSCLLPEEIPHRRAEWLHPFIQSIQLDI